MKLAETTQPNFQTAVDAIQAELTAGRMKKHPTFFIYFDDADRSVFISKTAPTLFIWKYVYKYEWQTSVGTPDYRRTNLKTGQNYYMNSPRYWSLVQ